MNFKYSFFILAISLFQFSSFAQETQRRAGPAQYAQMLGALTGKNPAEIADTLTMPFSERRDKALALYSWVARNIALDPKATRSNDKSKTDPTTVLKNRKTVPQGFALLYQELASIAGIRCLSIEGYTRYEIANLEEKPEETNHSWNVVQLGQSPADWYYVDVAKGSGHLDSRGINFIPEYSEGYFFPSKQLFDRDHFPENKAWQLGPQAPASLQQFLNLPLIHTAPYEMGLQTLQPATGILKLKTSSWTQFQYRLNSIDSIFSVEILWGDNIKKNKPEPMNFRHNNDELSFEFNFKSEVESPLIIRVNEKEFCTYLLKVEE